MLMMNGDKTTRVWCDQYQLVYLIATESKWDLRLQLMQVQLFQKEKVPKGEGEVIGVFYFL